MHNFYAPDLAQIHHAGYGAFARNAAPALLRSLRSAGIRRGTVVDLGCGSGIWLKALLRAGYAAIGVDHSRAMLKLARVQASGARLVHASAYAFEFPPCHAVTALGEVLCYLPDHDQRVLPFAQLCRRVARALAPGGLFIFDVLIAPTGDRLPYRTWNSGADWAALVEVHVDDSRRKLTRKITAFRKTDAQYRRSDEVHHLRILPVAEVKQALQQAGFSVRTLRHYGKTKLGRGRLAFCARKSPLLAEQLDFIKPGRTAHSRRCKASDGEGAKILP